MLLVLFMFILGLCSCQEEFLDVAESSDEKNELAPPKLDGRIIGGSPAPISQFPYQVSLQFQKQHLCGGSIINESYILTAAHCLQFGTESDFSVRAGSGSTTSGGVVSQVCSIRNNKAFNPRTIDSDISVVKLCDELPIGDNIKIIPLPEENLSLQTGSLAKVSGWGYTVEDGGQISPDLLQVEVPIVNRYMCMMLYIGEGTITRNMICAGEVTRGGKDSCQGDSGGPLVQNGKLIGVVSWGNGCARPRYPGIYTKVSNFLNFIKMNTEG